MSDTITGIVRIIHILTSVMWVGGAFLWGMIVAPRILARGPPQIRRPFAEAVVPAMTRYYTIVGPTAIVSGFLLVGMLWGWDSYFDAFQRGGGYGAALGLGALSAIAMAVIGFGVAAPTAQKLLAAMASASTPPTPEQAAQFGAYGKKLGISGMLVMVFGTVALIGMAWAVNVMR